MSTQIPPEDAVTAAPEHSDKPVADSVGADTKVDMLQNAVKLGVYVDALDSQTPAVERVCEDSVVREKLPPMKRDILERAVKYVLDALDAGREKFDLKSMKVHQVVRDSAGTVVILDVRIANADGGNTVITYAVEGRHGKLDAARSTTIEWGWTSGEDFSMTEAGGGVADYKDGKWIETY